MVSKHTLINLARGRAIRQRNLELQRKNNQKPQRRIYVPKGKTLLNPRAFVNPDLDVSTTDADVHERIGSGESLFASLDDVVPKSLQGGRR